MECKFDHSATRYVAVPGRPGLFLLATDPARYSDDLLARLAYHLAEAQLAPARLIGAQELRRTLRALSRPAQKAPPQLPSGHSAAALHESIGRLEQLADDNPRDRRGAILRMRYISGMAAKAVRQRLYLSESHYHRLHSAALAWVASDLSAAQPQDQNMGDL